MVRSIPPPRRPLTRRAFTLVEVVLVVMVLGIMAGVAVPRYQAALDGMELDCAAKRLAADLRLIRRTAVETATTRGVEFRLGLGYQSLTTGGGTVADPSRPATPLEVRFDSSGSRVSLSATTFEANELTFDFRGAPSSAGAITLVTGAASRTVAVNGVGEVSVTP